MYNVHITREFPGKYQHKLFKIANITGESEKTGSGGDDGCKYKVWKY